MDAPRARDHLDADQDGTDDGGRDPEDEIRDNVSCRIREP
jgi:hypothetical protein